MSASWKVSQHLHDIQFVLLHPRQEWYIKLQFSCVVFVAHTFISATSGGRGSPPLRGDFLPN